jgi:hypothetical protein
MAHHIPHKQVVVERVGRNERQRCARDLGQISHQSFGRHVGVAGNRSGEVQEQVSNASKQEVGCRSVVAMLVGWSKRKQEEYLQYHSNDGLRAVGIRYGVSSLLHDGRSFCYDSLIVVLAPSFLVVSCSSSSM